MARPRVFISSTYYDLRQIREEIERFIKELGYDAVRHEAGVVPYHKSEKLEKSAYREVEISDIVVFVIGSRFGAESAESSSNSISQVELKRALEHDIPVYVFIEKGAYNEYSTYIANKKLLDFKPRYVDDIRVYKFMEEIYSLPRNNPVTPFETARDITEFLRAQWAGLFQRLLKEQSRTSELRLLDEMNATAKTLRDMVDYLSSKDSERDDAIKSILSINHPVFKRIAEVTKTRYRVFFTNKEEFDRWITSRGWLSVDKLMLDEDSVAEWTSEHYSGGYLKLSHEIFDSSGNLISMQQSEWNDDWLKFVERPVPPSEDDDDIPF